MNKITTLNLAALLLTGVAFTACSGDDDETVLGEPAKKTVTLTVNATKGAFTADDETRALVEVQMEPAAPFLSSTWTNGSGEGDWTKREKVYVFSSSSYATVYADYTSQFLYPTSSGGSTTILTGDIKAFSEDKINLVYTGKLALDDIGNGWNSSRTLLKYTGQYGSLEDIATEYDYAIAENVSVKSDGKGGYRSTGNVTFVNQQAIVKFQFLKLKTDGAVPTYVKLKNISTLKITAEKNSVQKIVQVEPATRVPMVGSGDTAGLTMDPPDKTLNYIYAALRGTDTLGNGKGGFDGCTFKIKATVDEVTYEATQTNVTFEHGKFYVVNVVMIPQS